MVIWFSPSHHKTNSSFDLICCDIGVARIFQREGHTVSKLKKKGFLTMAKISSWPFHHLL